MEPSDADDRVIWLATEILGNVAVCECVVIPKVSGSDCKFTVTIVQSPAPGHGRGDVSKITVSLPAPTETIARADALAATHDRAVKLYGLSDVALSSNTPADASISNPSIFPADKKKWIADVTKQLVGDFEPGLCKAWTPSNRALLIPLEVFLLQPLQFRHQPIMIRLRILCFTLITEYPRIRKLRLSRRDRRFR